jgi:hypothetical protein
MTIEMKLITALCDALGFEVEKICVNKEDAYYNLTALAAYSRELIYEYKLTSRAESATEAEIYNLAIDAAAEVVRERFDEQEPWLEVEDILKLKVTT